MRRQQGHSRQASTPARLKVRLDGLIKNGVWFCNCDPREEASHDQVRKESKNRGRYFRSCKARKCDFFLWDEDAAVRESGVTVAEPDDASMAAFAPVTPQKQQTSLERFGFQPPPSVDRRQSYILRVRSSVATDDQIDNLSTVAQASERARSQMSTPPPSTVQARDKRKRAESGSGDEYGNVSSGEEWEMADAMERSSRKLASLSSLAAPKASLATPVKPPGASAIGGLLTPDTRGLDASRSKRQRMGVALNTPPAPTCTLAGDVSAASPAAPPADDHGGLDGSDYDITANIMTLLESQVIDGLVCEQVRDTLNAYALKTKGIIRGRDMVRGAHRKKDEKIAQLQERVASLENQHKIGGRGFANRPARPDF